MGLILVAGFGGFSPWSAGCLISGSWGNSAPWQRRAVQLTGHRKQGGREPEARQGELRGRDGSQGHPWRSFLAKVHLLFPSWI